MGSQAPAQISRKIEDCFREYARQLYQRTDRMFAALLVAEWIGAVLAALWIAPKTWSGTASSIHPHIWGAVFIGFAATIVPVFLVYSYPARACTRNTIAVCQILMSILLIDVTGGRIETHFHIFGSLAFLAFYRDWRVLVIASGVTALDHFIRGIWWPQSVYGVLTVSPWRWVEHAWWVAFEDFFLILSCRRNISEMWAVATEQARLSYGAHHDPLTGLPNRTLLLDRFERQLALARVEGGALAVAFIDLDRFKLLNDAYGHAAGDQLLIQVGIALRTAVGESGMVARLGGDEFLVLLNSIGSASEAEVHAGKLMAALNACLERESGPIKVTASMGVSVFPEHGATTQALQNAADRAMYYAKSRGRNKFAVFSEAIGDQVYREAELNRDLSGALARSELELHYQPLYTRDGQIAGMEALVRWNHPRLGRVAPCEFIPMAENQGLIAVLGEWVLYEACRQCVKWQQAAPSDMKVAVNVSAYQLRDNFAQIVSDALRQTGLSPRSLELELTESAVVSQSADVLEQLHTLRRMGVTIAIDDFGTGYSSLGQLQQLPVHRLKLDRSFVSQILDSPRAQQMVETMVTMAHQLGLAVVAEGVETQEQFAKIISAGCDFVQGYLLSKPVPAPDTFGLINPKPPVMALADAVASGAEREPTLVPIGEQ